jgi:hypothetical protein
MVSVRSNVYTNPKRPSEPSDNRRIPLPDELSKGKEEKLLPDYSLNTILRKIKDNIELDDIILLVLALVLLKDKSDDKILLILIISFFKYSNPLL